MNENKTNEEMIKDIVENNMTVPAVITMVNIIVKDKVRKAIFFGFVLGAAINTIINMAIHMAK